MKTLLFRTKKKSKARSKTGDVHCRNPFGLQFEWKLQSTYTLEMSKLTWGQGTRIPFASEYNTSHKEVGFHKSRWLSISPFARALTSRPEHVYEDSLQKVKKVLETLKIWTTVDSQPELSINLTIAFASSEFRSIGTMGQFSDWGHDYVRFRNRNLTR